MALAGALNPSRWLVWNPLRCRGFALPDQLVLMAKFVGLVAAGERLFPLFLPLWPVLDRVFTPQSFQILQSVVWWIAYGLLLFTRFVRTACLLLGGAWIVALLACQPCHSVAHTYVGCLLVILGCSSHASGLWLVRAQVVLLYAGATLNKALDPDWWNGRYFETLMVTRHQVPVYIAAASLFPPLTLSQIMGIATVLIQALLTACFLIPSLYAVGIATGVFFHGLMVALLNMTFGPFFLTILGSYLAFLRWPDHIAILEAPPWLLRCLGTLNVDGRYRMAGVSVRGARLTIECLGERMTSWPAFQRLVLYHPLTWMAMILPLMSPRLDGWLRNLTMLALILFLNPWLPRLARILREQFGAALRKQQGEVNS